MPSSPAPATGPTRDPLLLLAERFRAGIRAAFPELTGDIDPIITPGKQPELGDFQSNAAMPLAKSLKRPPRDVAAKIVEATDLGELAEPLTPSSIAGPGFINIRLRPQMLAQLLEGLDTAALGIEPASPAETVVVDLMGVNLAKQMHVGHLRSPIVGDAIARAYERLGHKVVRQNHVGDWGLPIAMVTARLLKQGAAGELNLETLTLDQLDTAYKLAQAECQRDAAGLDAVRRYGLGPKAEAELEEQVGGATEAFLAARQTLVKLQAKEPDTYAVWQKIYAVTMEVCLAACARLHVNVTAEHSAGESSYADELAPMVAELEARGIAEVSEGALIIRLDNPDEMAPLEAIKEPCLIRKRDGGYLYGTTDIAAIRRRVQKLRADRLIYAVDSRQSLHLRQIYAASRRAGYATNPVTGRLAVFHHAAFGSVLGEDGRPLKTRSGENVKLADLIEETVVRAGAAVRSRSPDLKQDEATAIAEAVGTAALKYADLCNDRVKDYLFSFDRMLAFEGNTGPYLLYALVRIKSIFRKASDRGLDSGWQGASPRVQDPAEKALALVLLRYPGVVRSVADSLEPHRLCQYLFDVAGAFSVFYDQGPRILEADPATRAGLLRLCALTARVLEDGLGVLGIPTLDRM